MIAFVGRDLADHFMNTGITFEGCRVQYDVAAPFTEAAEAVLRILKRHPSHDAVYFVALRQQQLGKIGAVLSRNPTD